MGDPERGHLAVNLRAGRTDLGLSLSQLAKQAATTKSYLCALESGKQSNPGVLILGRLARVLNTTLDALVAEPETKQPFAMPDRIAIDADGYGWRVWDDNPEMWSMVPQNPDNSPVPHPVTWFVPEQERPGA